MVYVRQSAAVLRLAESSIRLERRFCFYDQIHTTGMDIKHRLAARAALTLGKDMTWRDYAQGAYRMRGIAKGQTIELLVTPEVRQLVLRDMIKKDRGEIVREIEARLPFQYRVEGYIYGGAGDGAVTSEADLKAAQAVPTEANWVAIRRGFEDKTYACPLQRLAEAERKKLMALATALVEEELRRDEAVVIFDIGCVPCRRGLALLEHLRATDAPSLSVRRVDLSAKDVATRRAVSIELARRGAAQPTYPQLFLSSAAGRGSASRRCLGGASDLTAKFMDASLDLALAKSLGLEVHLPRSPLISHALL